jgi:hypothetical protein
LIANIPKLLPQFDQSDLPVVLAVIEGDAKVCGEAQPVVLIRNEPVDLSPWLGLRDTAISFFRFDQAVYCSSPAYFSCGLPENSRSDRSLLAGLLKLSLLGGFEEFFDFLSSGERNEAVVYAIRSTRLSNRSTVA